MVLLLTSAVDTININAMLVSRRAYKLGVEWVILFAAVLLAPCQSQTGNDWKDEVRKLADARNWSAALAAVDAQLIKRPENSELRAWHARVLMWSGQLNAAENEWKRVLVVEPNDPDNWSGLAWVYSHQGVPERALEALNRAIELDPSRADLHIARAQVLLTLGTPTQAESEFRLALNLDSSNADAQKGLSSVRPTTKHELLLGTERDFYSFTPPFQQNTVTLLSSWSDRWETEFTGGAYLRDGTNAAKLQASVTARSSFLGSLTLGGAASHDNGIVPRHEAFLTYDKGQKLSRNGFIRGIELVYGQHWYWYSTARVVALNEMAILYLPKDWMWSLAAGEARASFAIGAPTWTRSGASKLSFPMVKSERHGLRGNCFFAGGNENFSQIDQIGTFSSRTYGGGLQLQLTTLQMISASAAHQMRSQNRSQTSIGVTYGIRF